MVCLRMKKLNIDKAKKNSGWLYIQQNLLQKGDRNGFKKVNLNYILNVIILNSNQLIKSLFCYRILFLRIKLVFKR